LSQAILQKICRVGIESWLQTMGAEGARAARWPHQENLVEQLNEITAERSNRSSVHLKNTFIGSKGELGHLA
jgi:hypothetical protein